MMNSDANAPPPSNPDVGTPVVGASPSPVTLPRAVILGLAAVALAALLVSSFLWQKLSGIQEQLARQSADTAAQSLEARTLARQANELSQESSARSALFEARLSEVALQRSQLEDLIQSLSR